MQHDRFGNPQPEKDSLPSVKSAILFCVKTLLILGLGSQALAYGIHSALVWEKRNFAEKAIKAPASLLFFDTRTSQHKEGSRSVRHVRNYAVFDAFDGRTKRRITMEVDETLPYQPGESLTLLIDPEDEDDVRLPETNKVPKYRFFAAIAFGVAYFFGFLICGAVLGTTFIVNNGRLRRAFKVPRKG